MRNGYESPEILEVGKAQRMILGQKPPPLNFDAILGIGYQREPDMQDLDESDE